MLLKSIILDAGKIFTIYLIRVIAICTQIYTNIIQSLYFQSWVPEWQNTQLQVHKAETDC
jgi:hypothetical protein